MNDAVAAGPSPAELVADRETVYSLPATGDVIVWLREFPPSRAELVVLSYFHLRK